MTGQRQVMSPDVLPTTMRAVRLHEYGGTDVLRVDTVPVPQPGSGEVLVAVRATSINPGEAAIRTGALAEMHPVEFPFGEGSDVAGEVAAVGAGVDGFAPGDAVFGWTDERAAHADYVVVPTGQLAPIPDGVSVEQAGSLYVAGATAVAVVESVGLGSDDTVVISAAAGGVGTLVTQLAVATGATVIGLAGEDNHAWLRAAGATPLDYHGDDLADRIRAAAPDGVDAFLDLFGGGYVALALDELGVAVDRVDTIFDFDAVADRGVRSEGNAEGADIDNLLRLANAVAAGELELPIAGTFALDDVRAAYDALAARHTHGKLVLIP